MFTSIILTTIIVQIVFVTYGLILDPKYRIAQIFLGIVVILLPLTFGIAIVSTLW